MNDMCRKCSNLQQYEPAAGLLEACIADEIYKDDDGQEFDIENYEIMFSYWVGKSEVCPYFSGI